MSMLQYLQAFLHTLTSPPLGLRAGSHTWRSQDGQANILGDASVSGGINSCWTERAAQQEAGQRRLHKEVPAGSGGSAFRQAAWAPQPKSPHLWQPHLAWVLGEGSQSCRQGRVKHTHLFWCLPNNVNFISITYTLSCAIFPTTSCRLFPGQGIHLNF